MAGLLEKSLKTIITESKSLFYTSGEYMYIQGWFMSMYDKNNYNIVK